MPLAFLDSAQIYIGQKHLRWYPRRKLWSVTPEALNLCDQFFRDRRIPKTSMSSVVNATAHKCANLRSYRLFYGGNSSNDRWIYRSSAPSRTSKRMPGKVLVSERTWKAFMLICSLRAVPFTRFGRACGSKRLESSPVAKRAGGAGLHACSLGLKQM